LTFLSDVLDGHVIRISVGGSIVDDDDGSVKTQEDFVIILP